MNKTFEIHGLPEVAICIPTFNQAAYLGDAIESALQQTYPNIQIWISDDASTDNTSELIKKYQGNPNIHYFRQSQNKGISDNNNWLLTQPASPFIVRLDSDDKLDPAYVYTLLPYLLNDSSVGYAHVAVTEIDQNNNILRIRRLFRSLHQNAIDALHESVKGYRVAANICLFRAALIKELNYYKHGLNFGEDWELSIRIAAANYSNVYVNTPLAYYRVWNDSKNIRAKRKITEIKGLKEIYNETLFPLFAQKKLSATYLQKAMKTAAMNHSDSLLFKHFTPQERKELATALLSLHTSASLKYKLFIIGSGLGFYYSIKKRFMLKAKDTIKKIIR